VQAFEPARQARLVGEEDEDRVVAGQRPLLVLERGLVDRARERLGAADRPAQQEDEPAPADGDGRLAEQPREAMVGLGVGGVGEVVRADVDVAVAAQELDQAQLCDIPRDGGLGDGEAALQEPLDELVGCPPACAPRSRDRALAQARRGRGRGRPSAGLRAGVAGAPARGAAMRVRSRVGGEMAPGQASAMTTSSAPAPGRPRRQSAAGDHAADGDPVGHEALRVARGDRGCALRRRRGCVHVGEQDEP
jgi:hypothetical protein